MATKLPQETQEKAEKKVQEFLLENYDRSGIETHSGQLRKAIEEGHLTEQGDTLAYDLADLPGAEREGSRSPRPSTRVYGGIVFAGRPGITSERMMVFSHHGQFRKANSVGPAQGHDISLSDQQVQQLGEVLGEGIAAAFEKKIGDTFK